MRACSFKILALTTLFAALIPTAQADQLREHFDSIVGESSNKNSIYSSLIEADPELAKLVGNSEVDEGAVLEALKNVGTEFLDLRDKRAKEKKRNRDGLPANYSERLALIMLIDSMPKINLGEIQLTRNEREFPLLPQFANFVRSDLDGVGKFIRDESAYREIANAWVASMETGESLNAIFNWAIENSLKEGCLASARRAINELPSSEYWKHWRLTGPAFRDVVLRTVTKAIALWGDKSDIPALRRIVASANPTDPSTPNARYKNLPADQALGALLELSGLAPTDFLLRKNISRIGPNYFFQTLNDQITGLRMFEIWWGFLPAAEEGEESIVKQGYTMEAALASLLGGEFENMAEKRAAVNRLKQDPVSAYRLLLEARGKPNDLEERFSQAVTDLGDPKFVTRARAQKELEKLGDYAVPLAKQTLKEQAETLSSEATKTLRDLAERITLGATANAEILSTIQDRIEVRLADAFVAGDVENASAEKARPRFINAVGDDEGANSFFSQMAQTEPGMMNAYAAYLGSPAELKPFYREVLTRIYMRQELELINLFDKKVQDYTDERIAAGKHPRDPGTLFPGNLEDDFFGRLGALFFVRGETEMKLPVNTLTSFSKPLTSGIELGVYRQKNPVQEFIKNNPGGAALASLLKGACLSAQNQGGMNSYTMSDYSVAFAIALRYRFADVCRTMARRLCDPDFDFVSPSHRAHLLQFAIHSLMSFGKPEEDLALLVPLIEDKSQIRLGGFKKGQERKHIEVREFALIAARKMMSRNPEVMKNGRITGYCPVKRFVGLDIIKDPKRWAEIEEEIENWAKEMEEKRE